MLFLTMLALLDPINGDLLEQMINDHSNTLFKIAMGIVCNKEDAEDIIQETFFKVYRKIKSFYNLEREDLIALLVIYMKNTAKDHLRKQKRRPKIVSQTYEDENGEEQEYIIPDNDDAPDEVLIKREHSRQLAECIDLLPEG